MGFLKQLINGYLMGHQGQSYGKHERKRGGHHGNSYYQERNTTQPAGMACFSCHTPNAYNAKFCQQCGTSLAATCAACGFDLAQGEKFCPQCGKERS